MHMEPEVTNEQEWFECETNEGVEYVPADVVGYVGLEVGEVLDEDMEGWKSACRALRPFVEGRPYEVKLVKGFGARFSASGFLDRTEWCVFESEAAALAYLDEQV